VFFNGNIDFAQRTQYPAVDCSHSTTAAAAALAVLLQLIIVRSISTGGHAVTPHRACHDHWSKSAYPSRSHRQWLDRCYLTPLQEPAYGRRTAADTQLAKSPHDKPEKSVICAHLSWRFSESIWCKVLVYPSIVNFILLCMGVLCVCMYAYFLYP